MPLLRVKKQIILYEKLKTLWPLFIDEVQLPQGNRATTMRQFIFYHLFTTEITLILKPLTRFESGTLDWKSSTLTTGIIGLIGTIGIVRSILNVNISFLKTLHKLCIIR